MSTISTRSTREAEYVTRMAAELDQSTGQFLFNYLRHEVAEAARGTVFDPFDRDLTQEEVEQWLEDHIVYNGEGKMIAFLIGETVLWEEN